MSKRALAITLLTGLFAANAGAQDHQKIGVVFAVPATVGFEWEVTPRLALRPDVAFARSARSSSAPIGGFSFDSREVSVGLSAVFYVGNLAPLRIYLSPRYEHQLARNGELPANTDTRSAYAASVGAQYDLAPRFAMFAEAGVGYTRSRNTFGGTSGVTTFTSLANRATLGAILFF